MRRSIILVLGGSLILSSCAPDSPAKKKTSNPVKSIPAVHSLAILPLGPVDKKLISELKADIEKHLQAKATLLAVNDLPAAAFYKPRQRYIADSLLAYLRRTNNGKYEKILGITEKDISTRKGSIENWGILVLGSCPGETCVISPFRAGKSKVPATVFRRRISTLALHELGHTYGLEHCPVDTCIMKDAEGKMNLDDGKSYCPKCRNFLVSKGILSVKTPLMK